MYMYYVQYLRRTSKCSSRGYFNYMYSSTDKSSAPVICVQYIWHKLICSLKEKFIEKILMYHLKQRFNFGVLDIFLLCSFFSLIVLNCLSKPFALNIDYILALEITMYIYIYVFKLQWILQRNMCLYIYVLILTSVYFFLWQDCVLCLKLYKNRPRISTFLLNKHINVSQITWWDLLWW